MAKAKTKPKRTAAKAPTFVQYLVGQNNVVFAFTKDGTPYVWHYIEGEYRVCKETPAEKAQREKQVFEMAQAHLEREQAVKNADRVVDKVEEAIDTLAADAKAKTRRVPVTGSSNDTDGEPGLRQAGVDPLG